MKLYLPVKQDCEEIEMLHNLVKGRFTIFAQVYEFNLTTNNHVCEKD